MQVLVYNVDWDIEEYSKKEQKEILAELPKKFHVPISDYTDRDELDDIISDYISDVFGFCHNGFEYKIEKARTGW